MNNLMRLAHLLATDLLFQATCEIDLKSALAQRGLVLTRAELQAFSRVRKSITGWTESGGLASLELADPWDSASMRHLAVPIG